jgi:transposase
LSLSIETAIFYLTYPLSLDKLPLGLLNIYYQGRVIMIEEIPDGWVLVGPEGRLMVPEQDDITPKLAMLFEAQCEGNSVSEIVKKFGYSKQRYYQLLHLYQEKGAGALQNQKRGPKSNYRRTGENIRQIIRHRFLDSNASPEVIAQKMRQSDIQISIRSVERVIQDYGLQKKTL